MAKKNVSLTKKDKNPKGGLTQSGRNKYNKSTGGKLKAPVKGTPSPGSESARRKGSFLVRMGSAAGPMRDDKGRPTRLALSLKAWGHSGDKASAVKKGRAILKRYQNAKKKTAKK